MTEPLRTPRGLIEWAKADPGLAEIARCVREAGTRTWLEPDEQALLYGAGALAAGSGTLVEVGAFEGGSACFLAGGLRRRGAGRLHSVDPHLGAPPWFGLAPHKRTLDAFRRSVAACGLTDWVTTHLADSPSLAAVWPGGPVGAVLIDGDHSFLGALADFECWAPKVRPGGLILFDDVQGSLTELDEAVRLVRGLDGVNDLGTVEGMAVFRRNASGPWELLNELGAALGGRGVVRPWDQSPLHRTGLPPQYRDADAWPTVETGEAYMIAFFARCGPGPYGYTRGTEPGDLAVLEALSRDRGDGPVVFLQRAGERLRARPGQPTTGYRALFVRPEQAAALAPRLQTGGVLFTRHDLPPGAESTLRVRQTLLDAGLVGCGATADLHWGVWQPERLSAAAMLNDALRAASPSRSDEPRSEVPAPHLRDGAKGWAVRKARP